MCHSPADKSTCMVDKEKRRFSDKGSGESKHFLTYNPELQYSGFLTGYNLHKVAQKVSVYLWHPHFWDRFGAHCREMCKSPWTFINGPGTSLQLTFWPGRCTKYIEIISAFPLYVLGVSLWHLCLCGCWELLHHTNMHKTRHWSTYLKVFPIL